MSSIFEKYSVRRVINASGKMTILGVSTVDKEVIEAIGEGCKNFFIIEELINKFYNATKKDSFLFVGHAEVINRSSTKYKYVKPAIYKR
ncbi:hypothetical protein K6U39_23625 [Vibrio parahaemolyticus]|nr:hypothetical protein [Vibrio parahaemolyticus]